MIRLLLLVFLLVGNEGIEAPPVCNVNLSKLYEIEKPHHFNQVYSHIRAHEGNFVHHPRDRGGMTYGGIARRMHPDWFGWRYIDEAKPLQRHDSVSRAEIWVKDFYLTIWVAEGFENIESYEMALNLFDFRIHSSPRTVELFTNRVLVQMGCDPVEFGEDWVDSRFNQVDPTEFALRLKIQRIILFNHIVTRHPDQRVFYAGWLSRIFNI